MNAERLLEEFDRLSEAPGAVRRLRRFILDVTFQGGIQVGALSHPDSWSRRQVKDCARVINGRAYSQQELLTHGTPVIRIQNLNGSPAWYYSNLTLEPDKYCQPGDLLYAWSGTFGPYVWDGPAGIFHYHIWKLELKDGVDKRFFMHMLVHLTSQIKEEAHGLMLPHMTKQRMESWPILLPPLAEQRQIVAKVDELMALCDRLEAAQEERERRRRQLSAASLARLTAAGDTPGGVAEKDVPFFLSHSNRMLMRAAHVADLRKAILDLAVRGRLVTQSPEHSLAEHPSFHSTDAKLDEIRFGDDLPPNWQIGPLGRWFTVSGGIQKQPKRIPQGNARPYVGVVNVQRGRLNLEAVKEFELFPGELAKYRLEKGDLLVVEGNGSADEIGRCALWGGEIDDCVHQNHIIRCRPRVAGLEQFALLYLNSPPGRDEMRRLAVTTAGLFNLSVGKIQRILIPTPPLEEQGHIVAKVDELMAVCDELERSLETLETGRTRALEAVLHVALEEAGAPLPVLLEAAG